MKPWMHVWAGASLISISLPGADLPERILPQGVGVNIHFTRGHEKDLDLMAEAGFRVVRMDFGWAGIERRKSQYDWSAYDELTAGLEKRGMRPYYILDYSNPLYEETVVSRDPVSGRERRDVASPQHPESVAAFARWAAASVKHFRGHRIIWEIWNEPNISFWKPKPDVQQYITLALAAAQAVRKADPEATLVAPATSEIPVPFLEAFFKAGGLDHLDAVSIHPYRNYRRSPETAAEDYHKLRELIARYAPPGRQDLPILSGEWGYASHSRGVSLDTQAAYLVRQQLSNLLEGVPVSIWYDWVNDGPDPKEREHNFGTVTRDLDPKPAYRALRVMTRELDGYRIDRRLKTQSDRDYVLLLKRDNHPAKLAFWTLEDPHEIRVPIPDPAPGTLSGMTGHGQAFTVKVQGDKVELDLESWPAYLTWR
jgi:polysaccharide biosynthesis protein PslG